MAMIAQDQYPEFHEVMKERMHEPAATENELRLKAGYKGGVIRIWQKMAEYDRVSSIKALQRAVQQWLFTSSFIFAAA